MKPASRALSACAAALVVTSVPVEAQASSDVPTYFQTVWGLGLENVHWGDMHTHTYYSQDAALQSGLPGSPAVANPSTVYSQARAQGFRFSAVADHAEAPVPAQIADGASNVWESTRQMSQAANDEVADGNGVFIPFMGHEYTNPFPCTDSNPGDGVNECPGECTFLGENESCEAHGHKNVIYRSISGAPSWRASFLNPLSWNAAPIDCIGPNPSPYCGFNSYSLWAGTNTALWMTLRAAGFGAPAAGGPASALTIIHTPGNIHHNDWDSIDPDFVRNVEIFSQWGNSEGPAPLLCGGRMDLDVSLPAEVTNDEDDLIRPQLNQHWLVEGDEAYTLSFVGGSDDHAGRPGGSGNGNGGVTGVITQTVTRDGFFDAMWNKHTLGATYYASTGPMPLLFAVETGGKHLLGGDVGNIGSDGLVTLRILGASEIEQVQVVVDGCTVATLTGAVHEVNLGKLNAANRHYIYVRARRATTSADAVDGAAAMTDWHQTWSSPVYLRPPRG